MINASKLEANFLKLKTLDCMNFSNVYITGESGNKGIPQEWRMWQMYD